MSETCLLEQPRTAGETQVAVLAPEPTSLQVCNHDVPETREELGRERDDLTWASMDYEPVPLCRVGEVTTRIALRGRLQPLPLDVED